MLDRPLGCRSPPDSWSLQTPGPLLGQHQPPNSQQARGPVCLCSVQSKGSAGAPSPTGLRTGHSLLHPRG